MRYWLVMPAAGVGRRFGTSKPKQYAVLQGRTVIEWALAPFLADPSCAGAVVVLASEDPYWAEVGERIARRSVRAPQLIIAAGGAERSHTVRNGLAALQGLAGPDDWVLVHDAARPCLPAADLQRLLKRLSSHPVGGLLAAPAADTFKRAAGPADPTGACKIEHSVDRVGLWRALTPQMFRHGMLSEALDVALAADRLPTDEAQAVEWTGRQPLLVPGSARNIKITSSEDLAVAAALLRIG